MKNIKLYNRFNEGRSNIVGLSNEEDILGNFQEIMDLGYELFINIFEDGGRPGHEQIYIEIDAQIENDTIDDGLSNINKHIEFLNTLLIINHRLSEKYYFSFSIQGEEMCIYTLTYISKDTVL